MHFFDYLNQVYLLGRNDVADVGVDHCVFLVYLHEFKLDVLRDGKTIRTIPNISRTDFKLENLEREKNYSVRVVSIRNGQQANFSPQAHFLINKKTIKEVRKKERKKLHQKSGLHANLLKQSQNLSDFYETRLILIFN